MSLNMIYVALTARCLLGTVFAVSVVAKLRSRGAFGTFASWVRDLPVPAPLRGRRGMPLAVVMAATEVAIVVSVAFPWTAMAGLLIAAATLACFAAGAFLLHRRRPAKFVEPEQVTRQRHRRQVLLHLAAV